MFQNVEYRFAEVASAFHSQEPWVNVFLLKWITVPATFLIVNYTRISPNIITTCSLFFGVVSGVAYSQGEALMGASLYFVSYLFDAIDGKVARIRKVGSSYGAWFDIGVDRVNFAAVAIGLGMGFLSEEFGMVLTSVLIFLFMFGFESRYNIQANVVQEHIKASNFDALSKWKPANADVAESKEDDSAFIKWTSRHGVVATPISLVEILLILFIVAPPLGMYQYAAVLCCILLSLRIVTQQRYWVAKARDEQ